MTLSSSRRLAQLCKHLEPSSTEGTAQQEIKEILEALGDAPLSLTQRRMYYKLDPELPMLKDRPEVRALPAGWRQRPFWRGEDLPKLVAQIQKIAPPPDMAGSKSMAEMGEKVQKLTPPSGKDMAVDGALQNVKALLLYGCDAMDEAHNIIVPVQISGAYKGAGGARRDACLAHGMMHRQEGKYNDPTGRQKENVGWDSAKLILGGLGENGHEVYPKVLAKAKEAAAGKQSLEAHVRKHGDKWNSAEFVNFLKDAVDSKDSTATAFCVQIVNAEWRLLLDHCLAKAKLA